MKLMSVKSDNERKYFFTQWVIRIWHSLLEDVAMATGISNFKEEFDRYTDNRSISC